MQAIRDAWNKHIVLVFRGQQISQDDQLRFASYFGHLGERKRAKTLLTVPLAGDTRRGDAVQRGAVAGAARVAGLAGGCTSRGDNGADRGELSDKAGKAGAKKDREPTAACFTCAVASTAAPLPDDPDLLNAMLLAEHDLCRLPRSAAPVWRRYRRAARYRAGSVPCAGRAPVQIRLPHREDVIVQGRASARLIEGGLPTQATVAQVLVSRYADHLPLYCQAQICARQGVNLDRSTLADWVATPPSCCGRYTIGCSTGCEHPPSCSPMRQQPRCSILVGTDQTGQQFAYARDDRPWGGTTRRSSPTSMPPTARRRGRSRTSPASSASCRSMATPATSCWPEEKGEVRDRPRRLAVGGIDVGDDRRVVPPHGRSSRAYANCWPVWSVRQDGPRGCCLIGEQLGGCSQPVGQPVVYRPQRKAAWLTQSARVGRSRLTPCRAQICA